MKRFETIVKKEGFFPWRLWRHTRRFYVDKNVELLQRYLLFPGFPPQLQIMIKSCDLNPGRRPASKGVEPSRRNVDTFNRSSPWLQSFCPFSRARSAGPQSNFFIICKFFIQLSNLRFIYTHFCLLKSFSILSYYHPRLCGSNFFQLSIYYIWIMIW